MRAAILSNVLSPTLTSNILHHMDDPNVHFIMSDKAVIIARFFHARLFREVTLYHLGTKPVHKIGNFKTKGGFWFLHRDHYGFKEDADMILDL